MAKHRVIPNAAKFRPLSDEEKKLINQVSNARKLIELLTIVDCSYADLQKAMRDEKPFSMDTRLISAIKRNAKKLL